MHELLIPNWHPASLNQLMGRHYMQAHQLKKRDKEMVYWKAMYEEIPHAKQKREVYLTIILGKGQRGCDPDAYFKSLLDALVYCRLLIDDSRKWCCLQPVEFFRSTEKATLIQLIDIE